MQRAVKTFVLIALGAFLYSRLMNGTLLFYINQRFVTLTLLAAVGLILVGASYYRRPEQEQEHSHDALSWVGLLIVSLPMVLGWLVPPKPLGAAAIGNREINIGTLSSVTPPRGGIESGLVTGERNILDWLTEFQRLSDPAAFAGQAAHVIGFVYRDDRFSQDRFMVARFTVSCCVADAAPIGLIVQWPESASLPTDQWVEVSGRFAVGVFDGAEIPVLVAEEIVPTEPPAQPYLYL
jgi:uncharacterized repeat protein (TIGR03943 family)